MKKAILISILAMLVNLTINARTITGTVTSSEDGSAIPGVSVYLKNNPLISTTTDRKGFYSIEAATGDVLTFSFVGYKTKEVKIKNQSVIHVKLESELIELDEVIVMDCEVAENRMPKKVKTSESVVMLRYPDKLRHLLFIIRRRNLTAKHMMP